MIHAREGGTDGIKERKSGSRGVEQVAKDEAANKVLRKKKKTNKYRKIIQ